MIIDKHFNMASSSSSIVISFSIAILLLLIVLLLLSYNSKCKNTNKVERFEGNTDYSINSIPSYNNLIDQGINSFTQFATNSNKKKETNAGKEQFTNMMEGSPLNSNYSLLSEATGSECPTQGSDINVAYTTGSGFQDPVSCFKRDRLTKEDLLPAEATDKWSQINPSSSGDIADKNFLTAGYHIGINTVGQSMRNANLQLRSEIPNPQVAVSPWLVSTIEPDIRPVSFEIGSSPSP
jgi:hypothetical protein